MIGYVFSVSVGVIQTGWTLAGNAATAPILIAKFGWDEQEAMLYNTMINTCAIFGLTLGSLTAGYSLAYGRNKAIILWEVVALVGCLVSLQRSLWTICLGRLLIGLSAGLMNVASAKCIDEMIPQEQHAVFGGTPNMIICFGSMLAMILGFILPVEEADMTADENWRIIYAIPGVIALL